MANLHWGILKEWGDILFSDALRSHNPGIHKEILTTFLNDVCDPHSESDLREIACCYKRKYRIPTIFNTEDTQRNLGKTEGEAFLTLVKRANELSSRIGDAIVARNLAGEYCAWEDDYQLPD
jgi:hypothetical protein